MLKRDVELASRFILLKPLAEGAFSKVWLAEDREAGARVALKILVDSAANGAAIDGLQRESRLARAVQHPNILRVADVYRGANLVWMVMDYADGGNLSQLRGRPWTEILRATLPIARALGYVHQVGIVHRDVKPANVLMMSDGSPRLSDFGIALRLGERPDGSVGRGSPFSMSPQQHDGSAAAVADDIYAFGALLYELCCGQPPFYPHFSPERLRCAQPDPMVLREPLPKSIVSLVARCLEKRAIDRPQNMEVLAQELVAGSLELSARTSNESVLNPVMQPRIEPPKVNAPLAPGEPLRGEWRRSTDDGPTDSDLRSQGFRRGLTAAAGVLGVAGVLVVVFLLPNWVQPTADAKQASKPIPQPAKVEAPAQVVPKPVDFAALARAKQEAEEVRGPLDQRLQKLREQGAEVWAEESFAAAAEELAASDKDFTEREYVLAMEHLNTLSPFLTEMESRAVEVLKEQLADGAKAIQEGRSADATKAFTLAAKIEPKNAAAASGLKRAKTLDEVLSLVSSAERLEADGNLAAAKESYQKALNLDGQAPRAAEAIARIQSRFANDAFATAMARGFAALGNADYAAARGGFEAARKIRPGAAEIDQALRQVEQEERTRVISGKLAAARAFEGKERWADALQEYRAILQLDPTVSAAQESSVRVQPRADLNAQLEVYIKQPERLFNASIRNAARETLTQAGRVANPGPVLTQQMTSIRNWLARAEVPVAVALRSDNLTQVTIFRVGQLGAFEQRSLELAPGSYTLIGTRPGYRDVRREINVTPGAAMAPVEIRCEDKI
jgi:hypothetical protein